MNEKINFNYEVTEKIIIEEIGKYAGTGLGEKHLHKIAESIIKKMRQYDAENK